MSRVSFGKLRLRYLLFSSIIALGVILRFSGLGVPDLWSDENIYGTGSYYFSALSKSPFSIEFYRNIGIEWTLGGATRPELYYSFVDVAFAIFGYSEFAVRFPSALFGSISLILVYLFSKQVYGDQTAAVFSVIIMAVDGCHIWSSRIAYADASMTCFLIASNLFFLQALSVAGKAEDDSRKWLLPFLALGLAFFTKLTALIMVPVWVFFALLVSEDRRSILRRMAFGSSALLPFLAILASYYLALFSLTGRLGYDLSSFLLGMGSRTVHFAYLPWGLFTLVTTFIALSNPFLTGLYLIALLFAVSKRKSSEILLLLWIACYVLFFSMLGPSAKVLGPNYGNITYAIEHKLGGYNPNIYVVLVPPLAVLAGRLLASISEISTQGVHVKSVSFFTRQINRSYVLSIAILVLLSVFSLVYSFNLNVSSEPALGIEVPATTAAGYAVKIRSVSYQMLRGFLVNHKDIFQLVIVDDDIPEYYRYWYLRGFNFTTISSLRGDEPLELWVGGSPYPTLETSLERLSHSLNFAVLVVKAENRNGIIDYIQTDKSSWKGGEWFRVVQDGRACFILYLISSGTLGSLVHR